MARHLVSSLEPLESRIAPSALSIINPIPNILAGIGKTGATIDMGNLFTNQSFPNGTTAGFDTFVDITTNVDMDPAKPGIQAGHIVLELYDGLAPVTVQNFLTYLTGATAKTGLEDTFFHRLVSGFVLQGGGFKDTSPGTHIQTGPDVHNEYGGGTNPLLSNTLGTIAMAKTGIGPNTATSEWFVNLADNSSNLNNQNGGFSVFGKVTDASMAVINKIASLTAVDISAVTGNSALTNVPVQNGYTASAASSGKAPTANQLVDITHIKVIPPTQASPAGFSYTVTSDNTALVATDVHGQTLKLNYKPGATGVADITVVAKNKNGDTATETFTVTVQPNLIVSSSDTFNQLIATGSVGNAVTTLTNTGGGAATGKVDLTFYIQPLSSDSSGAITLNPNAIQIGTDNGVAINIASGKNMTITNSITMPDLSSLTSGTSYQIIATVAPSAGTPSSPAITELFSDDNFSLDGHTHTYNPAAKTNLVASSVTDTLPTVVVPGDTGVAKVQISNNTSFTAQGNIHVDFYLAQLNQANPSATTNQPTDLKIGQIDQSISLTGGQNITLSENVTVPGLFTISNVTYVVVAKVTADGISQVTTTDDSGVSTQQHLGVNAFGTFALEGTGSLRKNVPLSFTDLNGNLVTLKMSGAEYGLVSYTKINDVPHYSVSTFADDPTAKLNNTKLSASVTPSLVGDPAKNNAQLDGLTTNDFIGNVALGNADFSSDVNLSSGVKTLTLGNLTGGNPTPSTITLGTSPQSAGVLPSVQLGKVQDYSLTSSATVGSISASSWKSVNTINENISVPGLNTLTINGDLQADVTVSAPQVASTPIVKNFTVNGSLGHDTVQIAGGVTTMHLGSTDTSTINLTSSLVPLKNFTVAGTMSQTTVTVAGDVTTAAVGAMDHSNFLVGVNSSGSSPVIPAQASDFASLHTIGSFTITGTGSSIMTASNVAAANFGSILLNSNPDTTAQANFGFIAETIAKYQRVTQAPLFNLNPGQADIDANYSVTVLPS